MSALAHQVASEPATGHLPPAVELDRALRDASPAEVIVAALKTVGREHLALVSSFGTESAALLKVMADVDPAIPVIFLDTGWLFEETLAYRDTLIATLGLRDVRSIKPLEKTLDRARIPTANCGSPIPMPAAGSARSSRWRARWHRSRHGSTAASAFRAGCAPNSPSSRTTARG